MRSGRLRQPIVIQHDEGTASTSGQVTADWRNFLRRRAFVRPLTGRELIQAQQVNSEVTHEVRLRYQSGITSKMRVLLEHTRILEIQSVLNVDERNRELVLMCKETDKAWSPAAVDQSTLNIIVGGSVTTYRLNYTQDIVAGPESVSGWLFTNALLVTAPPIDVSIESGYIAVQIGNDDLDTPTALTYDNSGGSYYADNECEIATATWNLAG